MSFSNISPNCYINKRHKLVKFTPEKNIQKLPYDKKLWDRIFIPKKGVNFEDLQLTNIGKYSIAKKDVTKELPDLIKSFYKIIPTKQQKKIKELVITESNGGLGGITIGIAPYVKKVNTIEITGDHAKIIEHNLDMYNIKNVKVINKDYLDVLFDTKQDIIIADPPWGGPQAKRIPNLRLGLNNVDITCIINELYKKNAFQMFVLVAPYNFALQQFTRDIESNTYIVKKYRAHYLIFVFNY